MRVNLGFCALCLCAWGSRAFLSGLPRPRGQASPALSVVGMEKGGRGASSSTRGTTRLHSEVDDGPATLDLDQSIKEARAASGQGSQAQAPPSLAGKSLRDEIRSKLFSLVSSVGILPSADALEHELEKWRAANAARSGGGALSRYRRDGCRDSDT
jgi:hypothetical protein